MVPGSRVGATQKGWSTPIGTEIFPYSSESGEVGIGRLITVELDFEDMPQRLTLPGSPSTSDRKHGGGLRPRLREGAYARAKEPGQTGGPTTATRTSTSSEVLPRQSFSATIA